MMKLKIRKLLFSILLCGFLTVGMSACSENENYESYQPEQGSMFICVESYTDPYLGDVKILVDKETRIMYMYYWENSNKDYGVSGITVLYDSDGNPKKYTGVIAD